MLKIGLTGGIGSGKTAVANYFNELDVNVIDSDVIAKQLTEVGEPAYLAIINKFGKEILTSTQEIDRPFLKELIFDCPANRKWLENLLHPLIAIKIGEAAMDNSRSPYCIVAIPLLVETKTFYLINRVLVVDAPIEKQIERCLMRDKTDEETVRNIIKAQASREERLAIADDVILNDSSLEDLKQKVYHLHKFYLKLAKSLSESKSRK